METSTMRHLRLAAESGEAAAQFNLGVLYDSRLDDNGYAIEGNRAEAIKWLLAAASRACRAHKAGWPNSMPTAQTHRETTSTLVPGFCWQRQARAAFTAIRHDPGTSVWPLIFRQRSSQKRSAWPGSGGSEAP